MPGGAEMEPPPSSPTDDRFAPLVAALRPAATGRAHARGNRLIVDLDAGEPLDLAGIPGIRTTVRTASALHLLLDGDAGPVAAALS